MKLQEIIALCAIGIILGIGGGLLGYGIDGVQGACIGGGIGFLFPWFNLLI